MEPLADLGHCSHSCAEPGDRGAASVGLAVLPHLPADTQIVHIYSLPKQGTILPGNGEVHGSLEESPGVEGQPNGSYR
jgi:hypothetical protein